VLRGLPHPSEPAHSDVPRWLGGEDLRVGPQQDWLEVLDLPSHVTREKTGPDGARYVIAYNQTNDAAAAHFVVQSPAQSVTVRRGILPIEIKNGTTFEDGFHPYEAKVYEIR
jgi:hypothetical protein